MNRTTPEAQGISSRAILDFLRAADAVESFNSFVLVRHGAIVAECYWEPYGPNDAHMLFSLSKSFTSTAIGMLVGEGRLSVDDPVLGFFPDAAPATASPNLAAMRVRHLLTMTTGHDADPTRAVRQEGGSWVRGFLHSQIDHEPGTHFVYNSLATYMLSAIVQRLSGQRTVEYLRPRLFDPLGVGDAVWETSPEGIDAGGWGLNLRTMDVAKFGQLYLQKGVWEGRQVVPAAWVAEATSRQVPNGPSANPDWEQGYGYQFWRCRHDAYRGDGAFGQFCVVMPEQDAVVAITSGVAGMQAVLDLLWRHLLPAMGGAPLPEDAAGARELSDRLAGMRLPPVEGRVASAGGYADREFVIAENADGVSSVRLDGSTLVIRNEAGEQRIACGFGRWERGEADLAGGQQRSMGREGGGPRKVAASGAWTDDHTFVTRLVWYETPFVQTLTLRFSGDRLRLDQAANVAFGPAERPSLEGRAGASAQVG